MLYFLIITSSPLPSVVIFSDCFPLTYSDKSSSTLPCILSLKKPCPFSNPKILSFTCSFSPIEIDENSLFTEPKKMDTTAIIPITIIIEIIDFLTIYLFSIYSIK